MLSFKFLKRCCSHVLRFSGPQDWPSLIALARPHSGLRRHFWALKARNSVFLSVDTPLCPSCSACRGTYRSNTSGLFQNKIHCVATQSGPTIRVILRGICFCLIEVVMFCTGSCVSRGFVSRGTLTPNPHPSGAPRPQTPQDPFRTLGIGLRQGPSGLRFLVSEVPL